MRFVVIILSKNRIRESELSYPLTITYGDIAKVKRISRYMVRIIKKFILMFS